MRFLTHCHSVKFRAALTASTLMVFATGPAFAGKHNPAPITYMGQGASINQAQSVPAVSQARGSAPAPGEEGKRIAFRYPGQSVMSEPAPVARDYASVNAPRMSAPAQITDQAMAPNGFDARATASRIDAAREMQVVESEPLVALEPVAEPAGQGQGSMIPAPVPTAPAVTFAASPETGPVFDETGVSVTYGDEFAGLPTANGEVFDQGDMTAAHPTLPLPSLVQVINLDTQKEVVVRVNDRGPFEDGASLQLSKRAAGELAVGANGRANVRIRYLGPAPVSSQTAAYKPSLVSERIVPASYATGSQTPTQMPVIYASVTQNVEPMYPQAANVGQGSYFVQLGSFADISNAQTFKQSLGSDLPVVIVPARVNGADYFRVRVGPLDSRASAAGMRDDLADRGIANGRIVSAD